MMKGNVWIRGRLIPVTSVVGVVLSFAAWVVALGTHPGARVVGPLWMIGGLAIYAGHADPGRASADRARRGRGAAARGRDRHRLLDGRRAAGTAGCDRRGDDGDGLPPGRRGRRRGGRRERDLRPVRDPLDRRCRSARRRWPTFRRWRRRWPRSTASSTARSWPGRAARAGSSSTPPVEHDAGLIVVGSPQKHRVAASLHEEFFGQTVDFILRKAPCRVIVTHFPAGAELVET